MTTQPSAFLQWKGTDACFDFYCVCGKHVHCDGYFANYVECPHCNTVFEMPHMLYPTVIDRSAALPNEPKMMEADDDQTPDGY